MKTPAGPAARRSIADPYRSYDADGNLISRNEVPYLNELKPATYSYDAAGRKARVTQTRNFTEYFAGGRGLVINVFTNSETYDGDGQVARFVRAWTVNGSNGTDFPVTAYYLRSTVLGGRMISEYSGQGLLNTSYAYAGDERVGQFTATYNHTAMTTSWRFADPVTSDEFLSASTGAYESQSTLDPNGVDVGLSDPFPPDGSGNDTGGDFDPTAKLRALESNGAQCLINGTQLMNCMFVG